MISRKSLLAELRRRGWRFQLAAKRAEFWRHSGTGDTLTIPRTVAYARDILPPILRRAGATPEEIAAYLAREDQP